MITINKILPYVSLGVALIGMSPCCSASMEIPDFFKTLDPEREKLYMNNSLIRIDVARVINTSQALPETIQIERINDYTIKLSKALPDGVNCFVHKKNEDNSWEDIFGNQYAENTKIEQQPSIDGSDVTDICISYENGNWKVLDYRYDPKDFILVDYSILNYRSLRLDKNGRIMGESGINYYYEDGSWINKRTWERGYRDGSIRDATGKWKTAPNVRGTPLLLGETYNGTTILQKDSWVTSDSVIHCLGRFE